MSSFPEPLSFNGGPKPEEPWDAPFDPVWQCAHCDRDTSHPIELAFGLFCSEACADEAEAKFTERMKRRGFMEVQPDIFDNPFGD
jgi:hypothetical protein